MRKGTCAAPGRCVEYLAWLHGLLVVEYRTNWWERRARAAASQDNGLHNNNTVFRGVGQIDIHGGSEAMLAAVCADWQCHVSPGLDMGPLICAVQHGR